MPVAAEVDGVLVLELNLCSSLGDCGRGSRWVVVNTDAELKCKLLRKLTLC